MREGARVLRRQRTAPVASLLIISLLSLLCTVADGRSLTGKEEVSPWHPRHKKKGNSYSGVFAAGGFSELLQKNSKKIATIAANRAELHSRQKKGETGSAESSKKAPAPTKGSEVYPEQQHLQRAPAPTEEPQGEAKMAANPDFFAKDYPDFTECEVCMKCNPNALKLDFDDSIEHIKPKYEVCPICNGCTHDVENIDVAPSFMGYMIKMQTGNTGASIFTTDTPRGKAVIKLHGIKSDMVSENKFPTMMRSYHGRHYKANEHEQLFAVMKMQDECGFEDINIKEWVAPLRAVVPGSGARVEEKRCIFAELALGASLEALNLRLPKADLLKAIAKVPSERVVAAALFDMVISQGDRHGENAFLTEDGHLKLIDTRDTAFSDLDTIWHPGSFVYERNRIGNEGIFEKPLDFPRRNHWPQMLFDYRCHVPGGVIGFNYPPQMRTCLEKLANMNRAEIMREYSVRAKEGQRILETAMNLLTVGFEETVRTTPKRINYRNQPKPYGYPWPEPCCKLVPEESRIQYECGAGVPANRTDGVVALSPLASDLAGPVASLAPLMGAAYNEDLLFGIYNRNPRPPAPDTHKMMMDKIDFGAEPTDVLKEAAKAAPDVFARIPRLFNPKFKNPCWENAKTKKLECLPFFHMIGGARCGATDLYQRLRYHRSLTQSKHRGPHFWDERHPVDWYLDMYERDTEQIKKDPKEAIIGDASNSALSFTGIGIMGNKYMDDGTEFKVSLPEVMLALQPTLKVIAVLRNPVDRLYSAFLYHKHLHKKYPPTAEGFNTYAIEQVSRMEDCYREQKQYASAGEDLEAGCVLQMQRQGWDQLVKGMYYEYLKVWLKVMPPDQILVLLFEEYAEQTEEALASAMGFLDMEEPTDDEWEGMLNHPVKQSRPADSEPMRPSTRAMLHKFYTPHNLRLAKLLKDNKFMWNLGSADLLAGAGTGADDEPGKKKKKKKKPLLS